VDLRHPSARDTEIRTKGERMSGCRHDRLQSGTTRPVPLARVPGFTLVELLVVVSIMAVLAGLLFPVLVQVREHARQSTCLSNLQQVAKAHLLYLQDWDEQLPYWYLPGAPRPRPFGPHVYWTEYLQPYLRTQAVFRDPSARWIGPEEVRLADYALVTWGPGGFGTPEAPYYRWPGPPLTLGQVARPAETLSLLDGWSTTAGSTVDGWGSTGWTMEAPLRHGGGTNVSFVDGHAGWLAAGQMARADTNGRGVYWLHYGYTDW
jgi:prepilin-type N-terminal cleavage/methylation domain-containing protein/prepilin-type processing-associated H-X9-DG protein